MTRQAAPGKPKFLGSGGSMVVKLKLKGIDGRAPPGVEGRTTAKAFAKNVFISQERKSEVRRRSDTVVVLTINR